MRFLIVSNLFPPVFIGGYEIGASWVARCLREFGHQVCVLTASDVIIGKGTRCEHLVHHQCPPDADSWVSAGSCFYGVDVLDGLLFDGHGSEFAPAKQLLERHFSEFESRRAKRAEAIVRFSPDVVLLFNPACILDPVLDELANLPALKRIPVISYVSDDWLISWHRSNPLIFLWNFFDSSRGHPHELSPSRLRLFEDCIQWEGKGVFRFLSQPRIDHRFFTSKSLQERYEREKPEQASGSVLPWGLPRIKEYPILPREYLRRPEPLSLVYTGQIEPHKGIFDLLRALLLTKRPHKLAIFGDVKTEHAEFCRQFVEYSDLHNRVEFAGRLPPDKVWSTAIEKAEVYLLPSRFIPGVFQEPFSIALLQAMAAGFPVIASDSGGSPEAITHGINGFLHKANSVASLVAAIDLMEEQRENTIALANAACERAYADYSIETMTSKIEELAHRMNALAKVTNTQHINAPSSRADLFYLVHNANRDPANSGCVRVARRLANELQKEVRPWFVRWRPELAAATFMDPVGAEYLSRFNGPEKGEVGEPYESENGEVPIHLSMQCASRVKDAWLILPELLDSSMLLDILSYARRQKMRCAAIFYDAIPLLRPELCSDEIRQNHAAYMDALARCDMVIPISEFSSRCLLDHWQQRNISACQVIPILLAGEFNHDPVDVQIEQDDTVEMLCVSTLEPRKNHRSLLAALELIDKQSPLLKWKMHFVGNSYGGALDITKDMEERCRRDSRIVWHRIVDDQRLGELYQKAKFTIYPSVIEGYGLPIVESVWHGKPCICSRDGVMAELASDGGCVTVNVENTQELANAIRDLAENADTRRGLSERARRRVLKTWNRYGLEFATALRVVGGTRKANTPRGPSTLEEILYSDCVDAEAPSTFSHAERALLSSLMQKLKPIVALEVGCRDGSNLSLMREFSHSVFGLTEDAGLKLRNRHQSNVSIVTGQILETLPLVQEELDISGLPIGVLLVNSEALGFDLAKVINQIVCHCPLQDTCLIIHGSFDREIREVLLSVEWNQSPYVYLVDLDVVQGHASPHTSLADAIDTKGGIAIALLKSNPRSGSLLVRNQANVLLELCKSHFH